MIWLCVSGLHQITLTLSRGEGNIRLFIPSPRATPRQMKTTVASAVVLSPSLLHFLEDSEGAPQAVSVGGGGEGGGNP